VRSLFATTFKDSRTMPVLEEQNHFVADFEQAEQSLAKIGPAPLHRLRETAIQRFAALGLPTLDDEEWRFTPLAPLTQMVFKPGESAVVDAALVQRLALVAEDCHRLVFVNGGFAPALSSLRELPLGTVADSLASAFKSHRDKVEPYLAQY